MHDDCADDFAVGMRICCNSDRGVAVENGRGHGCKRRPLGRARRRPRESPFVRLVNGEDRWPASVTVCAVGAHLDPPQTNKILDDGMKCDRLVWEVHCDRNPADVAGMSGRRLAARGSGLGKICVPFDEGVVLRPHR